jgi:nucleoside-diphosphate-sugar epimerase
MKVFVTGATGYIGREVCRALHRASHQVVGLAREKEKATLARFDGLEWVIGNVRDGRTFFDEAKECDALVHLASEGGADNAAVDRNAVEALLDAVRKPGLPRVLVYTSGVWVLGPTGESHLDEGTPIESPASLVAWRPAHERAVLDASGGDVVTAVVRPGIVYGGHGGMTEAFFSQAVEKGKPTIIGDGQNRWTGVHRADLGELYVRLVEAAFSDRVRAMKKEDRVFHGVAGGPERVADMARAASRAAGGEDAVGFWPLAQAREKLGPFADAVVLDQVVRATRSDEVLGWKPRFRGFTRNAPELFEEWKAGR